jgi:hypothetical protein
MVRRLVLGAAVSVLTAVLAMNVQAKDFLLGNGNLPGLGTVLGGSAGPTIYPSSGNFGATFDVTPLVPSTPDTGTSFYAGPTSYQPGGGTGGGGSTGGGVPYTPTTGNSLPSDGTSLSGGLAVNFTAGSGLGVAEPASLALLATALLGVGIARRYRVG